MHPTDTQDDSLPRALRGVLEAMDERARKRFADFLAAPVLNPQRRLVELHALVEAQFFSSKPPAKSWDASLRAAGINPAQLPKLFTLLHQRLDLFLAMEWVDSQSHLQAVPTVEAYLARGVDPGTTEKRLRQWRKRLDGDRHSIAHGQQQALLEHLSAKLRLQTGSKVEGSYFQDMHDRLDLEHLLAKLKYACASVNEAQLLKLRQPEALVAQVQALRNRWTQPLPAFGRAYAAVLDLLLDPQQPLEVYEGTLALLLACEPAIAREDNADLLNYVLNLCYRRLDVGTAGFAPLAVRIYEHLIALDLLAPEGVLSPRTYWNIVSLNCREQRWDWCRTFIEDHRQRLPREDQAMLPVLCAGLVDFYEGHLAAAVMAFKRVVDVGAEDHFLALESRSLLLKAYFLRYHELDADQHEELYRQVNAFKMYVRRHGRLDAYHQACYNNFINYFQQMLRHLDNHGPNKPFPESLRQAVIAEKKVTNKAWLLKAIGGKN